MHEDSKEEGRAVEVEQEAAREDAAAEGEAEKSAEDVRAKTPGLRENPMFAKSALDAKE